MKKQVLEKFYNLETRKLEIGIDEVGRGPMFGRVYCAAVILPNDETFKYFSKKNY
jgi:ribonuclease HII